MVFILSLFYTFILCLSVLMLGMESAAGDVVISAGKRDADVNVAISFFLRKVDVPCMLCWSCLNSISLCWVCFGF